MRNSLGLTCLALLALIVALAIQGSDAASCGNNLVCPIGQCCSANNQCGTTDEFCGAGCNPTYGRCKGVMQKIALGFWGQDLEVVSTIQHPSEPFIYVFVNVLGSFTFNVTQYVAGNISYNTNNPFSGHESFKRSLLLQYDADSLNLIDFASVGTYTGTGNTNLPGADFEFVDAVWANGTLWAGYNVGPRSSSETEEAYIVFASSVDGVAAIGALDMLSTGYIRFNLSSLIPATGTNTPPYILSFPTLKTSAFGFDGTDLLFSGSFTDSPLNIPSLRINETMGPRSSCVGSRDPANFQWCAGAEDGWNFELKIVENNGTIARTNFVYSQSTGPATPERRVQALSVSSDASGSSYSCYSTNNLWLTEGHNLETASFTVNGSNDFNHSATNPADNLEVYCYIRDSAYTTYTIEGVDGDVTSVYATAVPTSTSTSRKILFTASTSSKTVFNITGVQGTGTSLGYSLSANPGVGTSSITQIFGTSNDEVFVSGLFKGKLEGDPDAPISYVTGQASTNSMFIFYYNHTDSPTQITPSAIFTLGNTGVNFTDSRVLLHRNSTFSAPQLVIGGVYQTSTNWRYGLTVLLANGGLPTFMWGIYSPEQLSRQPSPIFVPIAPNPIPSNAPTGAAPSSPLPMTWISALLMTLILAFLSL